MGIRSNKIFSAIFLVLVLTVTVSITMAPIAKAEDVEPMATVFDVSPNPVAVGDVVVVEWDISPDPPSGYFYENIVVSLVMPDESMQILGPFMANSSGGMALSFVPTQIGTYSATLSYPGQVLDEDHYFPFLAGPIYLDVVANLLRVHNPVTGLDYATIQAAIDAPETLDGHTILVDSGTYHENIVVNKSISLIGENSSNTIVDGGGVGTVLNITANNVTVSNFTIKKSSTEIDPLGILYIGLILNGCNNTIIQNNKITQNYVGLLFYQSSNNLFRNNTIVENIYNIGVFGQDILEHYLQDIDTSNTVEGEPIYYWINHENEQVPLDAGFVALINCTNVSVQNLNLKNNFNGLLIAYSSNTTIQNNNITNNGYGVNIWYGSYDNQIIENIMEQNHVGVFGYGLTYRPSNNWFIKNAITANDLGIYLWRTYNNTICGNSITANDRGIHFWATYNSSVYENDIRDNEHGILLDDSVKWNRFYHNNLINNTVQASASSLNTEGNAWDDDYPSGGNYWSDYTGTDSDGDGIGDTPYVIDENNQDNYPLMAPIIILDACTWEQTQYFVDCVSNSTVQVSILMRLKGLSYGLMWRVKPEHQGSAE